MEIIYLSLHCHHQNDSYINMGSDKSHFNVSLIVRDKVRRLSTNHNLFEEKGEPKRNHRCPSAYQSNALPLGPNRLFLSFFGHFCIAPFSALKQTHCARR